MAGLMEGIGRARPFSNLTGNILENAQGLFKTQMTMQQMEQERRSREIQDNLNTLKLQETKADIEKRRRPVFKEDFLARYPDPETGKYYWDQLSSGGYVKNVDIGGAPKEYFEHGDFKEINELIEKEPKRQEGYLAAQLTDLGQKKAALNDQYRKAVEKGDSEKAQQFKEQFDAIKSKEGIIFDAYLKLKKPESAEGMTEYQKESIRLRAEGQKERKEEQEARREDTKEYREELISIRKEAAEDRKESKKEGSDSKEAVRRKNIHQQVEKIFGISEFLESAKDPELRRNYGEVAAFSDEVSRNPEGYGLRKNAGEAEIAKKAYDIWALMKGKKVTPQGKPPLSTFEKK